MKYKEVKIPFIKEKIVVREDGKEIVYKEKKPVHQSLVKNEHHRNGYYMVSIEGKRMYVHRLVAEAFVINRKPVSFKMVLHKDCNSLNNHYKNLEWGDRKKLIENRINNGVQDYSSTSGTYRGASKISHNEALNIAKRLENGEFAINICKEYNVSEMTIARIRKRYLKKPASKRYPAEVKETVLRLLIKHKPHELVDITGLKYCTLYRWAKKNFG